MNSEDKSQDLLIHSVQDFFQKIGDSRRPLNLLRDRTIGRLDPQVKYRENSIPGVKYFTHGVVGEIYFTDPSQVLVEIIYESIFRVKYRQELIVAQFGQINPPISESEISSRIEQDKSDRLNVEQRLSLITEKKIQIRELQKFPGLFHSYLGRDMLASSSR
jgi:hypothetical protein